MSKKEIQQRVLKNGKPLALDLFTWNEETRVFSSDEDYLVLEFTWIDGVNFNTGSYCTFNTGSDCAFKTGSRCIFETSSYCTFNTGSDCTFKTDSRCAFETSSDCTFDAGSDCTFKTEEQCVVVRRDVHEIIELDGTKEIKLNGYLIKGYEIINKLKESLCD